MNKRIILGFIVAPLMTPLIIWLSILIRQMLSRSLSLFDTINHFFAVFLIYLPFAYLIALVLGLPALIFLRRVRRESLLSFAIGGVIVGVASRFILAPFMFTDWKNMEENLLLAFCGLCSAVAFWLVANRPDSQKERSR